MNNRAYNSTSLETNSPLPPLCHVGNSTESDMSIAPRLIFACPLSLMANCGLVIEAAPQYTNHWSCFFLALVGSTFSIPSVTRREERGYSSFLMVISIMAKTSSDSRVTRTFGGGAQLPEELYHLLFLQGLFDVFFVVHNYFFICYNTSLTVNFHAYHCLLNNQVCLFYFKDSWYYALYIVVCSSAF